MTDLADDQGRAAMVPGKKVSAPPTVVSRPSCCRIVFFAMVPRGCWSSELRRSLADVEVVPSHHGTFDDSRFSPTHVLSTSATVSL